MYGHGVYVGRKDITSPVPIHLRRGCLWFTLATLMLNANTSTRQSIPGAIVIEFLSEEAALSKYSHAGDVLA